MTPIRRIRRAPEQRLSYSQLSHPCGLQLKFHRERAPQGPRGIALLFGSAVGAGIEHQVLHHQGPEAAAYAAIRHLRTEVELSHSSGEQPIRWDDPPRITKKGEFHTNDCGLLPDLATAERLAGQTVRAWVARFPSMAAVDEGVERSLTIKLKRPRGWTIECVTDLLPDDGGIVDVKTSAGQWTPARLAEKRGQAWLYQAAYLQTFGRPPAYFHFHVLPKGTTDVQVLEVPYEPVAINRYLEHVIRPTITAIEADVYVPNPNGWHCSAKFCSWWGLCPLGEAAHLSEPREEAAA